MKKALFAITLAVLSLTSAIAQQEYFHMGLQIGWHGGIYPSSHQDLACSQNSIYDFGLQFRIGGRLYGATGLNCHVANQSFSRGDSSCELKQDYLGIPLRIGFSLMEGQGWNWRIETGMEYRTGIFISPNDWNLHRKSVELNRNHLDFTAGMGGDWGKFSADIFYRRVFSGPLREATQGDDQLWISIGFFLK
jgi:hypothetical protein